MSQELPSKTSDEQAHNKTAAVGDEETSSTVIYKKTLKISGRSVRVAIRTNPQHPLGFLLSRRFRTGASQLDEAPGFHLVKWLEFFCRKKTMERLIEPMHAEFLVEYYAALKADRVWKARWIRCQMRFYLVKAVASEKVLGLIGKCFSFAFKAKADE